MNLAVAFHMCYGPNTQLYTSDCCQGPASGQQDQPDSTGVICVGVKPRRLEQSTQAPLAKLLTKKLRAAGSLILKAKRANLASLLKSRWTACEAARSKSSPNVGTRRLIFGKEQNIDRRIIEVRWLNL